MEGLNLNDIILKLSMKKNHEYANVLKINNVPIPINYVARSLLLYLFSISIESRD